MNIFWPRKFGAFGASLLLACGIFATHASAQTTAPILGEIAGDDISVLGPSHIIEENSAREIAFGGGSTLVVHSGKARVEFAGGGELEICGPAKFTVLASGEALTVALSFGRVHVKFDASRPITIYTPLILATPMALGNQPRDVTIGLMNTGTMCILAARGAVQVQQQLSGETLVIPQPGEILLQGTSSLGAARAASGSCRCDFDEPIAQQSIPSPPFVSQQQAPHELIPNQTPPPAQIANQTPPGLAANAVPSRGSAHRRPSVTKSQLTPSRSATAAEPPVNQPARIDLPPIGYDARSVTAATEPLSVATLMLAKEEVVQPDWIFHGTVAAAPLPAAKRVHAGAAHPPAKITAKQQPKKPAARKGFRARFHDFFAGSPAKSDGCVGEGCS
ncbi:MAG TPA: hypothetical protein VND42_04810 [Candidatus Acidoferrales bacterium]|nr:hypothetical protein [Candidatus Acidoferrales bacterium]